MKLKILSISILTFASALPAAQANAIDPFCSAISQLRAARYGETINSLSRVIRSNPRLSEAYFYRGIAHQQRKRYAEALANYNQALSIGVSSEQAALMNRATTLAKMGDYVQAIEDLKIILQMNDEYFDYVYRGIAHSYLKIGNRRAAIDSLQKLAAKYYRAQFTAGYMAVSDDIKRIQAGAGSYDFDWRFYSGLSNYTLMRCYR